MDCYRIRDWDKHFENNRTRLLKHLDWVPMPNKQDGDGYTELVDHPDGPAHYGAWCAIVQVASKCHPRGTLLRDGSTPHTPQSLARKSRLPAGILQAAITRLLSIGWIEVYDHPAPSCQNPAPSRQETDTEGKGREGKGTEGKDGAAQPPAAETPEPGTVAAASEETVRLFLVIQPSGGNWLQQQLDVGHPDAAIQEAVRRAIAGGKRTNYAGGILKSARDEKPPYSELLNAKQKEPAGPCRPLIGKSWDPPKH